MNANVKTNGSRKKGRPVYLDYQATTPTDPRVVEAMAPFFGDKFGNPHSRNHFYGWEAADAVEKARRQIAALIGAEEREIIFTSGATESNNLAIKGVARFHGKRRGRAQPGQGNQKDKNHIVTVATEHKCVLEACAAMEREGFGVTVLPVAADGLIDLDQLRNAVTGDTVLVSVMAVNNEIGVIQPVAEIGAICREEGAFFHTDAAQAAGRIPLDVEAMTIDLMSISGHKAYGPMGIGVLYVRRRPRVRLEAMISGGGQERGMRSGTLPAPLCVGLGEAAAIAAREMEDEALRLLALRGRFLAAVMAAIPDTAVNGSMDSRIPGNLNLSFSGVQAEDLMAALKDLAISTGSACTSASVEPSYVLKALGLGDEMAHASVRISFGRFTTGEEVDFAAAILAAEVERLRRVNPRQRAQA
ncbi:MAG: IscS subfamily cysteine desulfurase [Rhodospirillaceae bacterium]|jgi:cysteine desulfurase|nr:IscS subfamily cysteine desulfurase [Rhodospirillaceae bacterium]|tara:strand:- start:4562 stop:5809 length:1248 start_codon:yes stop_codon:yes gene_type:complete